MRAWLLVGGAALAPPLSLGLALALASPWAGVGAHGAAFRTWFWAPPLLLGALLAAGAVHAWRPLSLAARVGLAALPMGAALLEPDFCRIFDFYCTRLSPAAQAALWGAAWSAPALPLLFPAGRAWAASIAAGLALLAVSIPRGAFMAWEIGRGWVWPWIEFVDLPLLLMPLLGLIAGAFLVIDGVHRARRGPRRRAMRLRATYLAALAAALALFAIAGTWNLTEAPARCAAQAWCAPSFRLEDYAPYNLLVAGFVGIKAGLVVAAALAARAVALARAPEPAASATPASRSV